MATSVIKHATDTSFDEDVLQSDQLVLVDYWAEWCGPCKMLSPILEQIADEYSGRLSVVKLDVDQNQETAAKYSVRGIPTLMLFRTGALLGTKVGAQSPAQLRSFIDSHL